MALTNLMQLTADDIDEALKNAGYEDNTLHRVSFNKVRKPKHGESTFVYDIVYRDTNTGGMDTGKVYVYVCVLSGKIKADF